MGKNNSWDDIYYTDEYWDTLCDLSYDFDGFDDLYGGLVGYEGAFGVDEKEYDDYLRVKRIEYKTGMSYDEFLQLDVLEQMKLYELLDLRTPSEKEQNRLNIKIDSMSRPSKLDIKLEKDIKNYDLKEKVKKLILKK